MGGDPGPTYTESSQMPHWAKEPHTAVMAEAQKLYSKLYEGYGWGDDNKPGTDDDTFSQRIAGFDDMQNAAFNARQGMFDAGDPYGESAARQLEYAGTRLGDVGTVGSTYNPGDYTYEALTSQYKPTAYQGGTFGQEQAEQYMSPYQQAVTNQQLRAATEAYEGQKNKSAADRAAAGSRGSYRAQLDSVSREGEYLGQMSDIQERGSAAAYEGAQQQFERDRGARLRAEEMTDSSLRAANDYFMRAEARNRDNLHRAQQSGDQSLFRAAQMQMEADQSNRDAIFKEVSARGTMASATSRLGTESQARMNDLISELQRSGATKREMDQAGLDMMYEDFMRQQTFDQDQINWMLGVISGSPGATQTYTKRPGPSAASELLGYGLGASSLAGMLGYGGDSGGGK